MTRVILAFALSFWVPCIFSPPTKADQATVEGTGRQQFDDANKIEFHLQNMRGEGVVLRVPRDYLDRRDLEGGATDRLQIYLTFPDLVPRQKDHRSVAELFAQVDSKLKRLTDGSAGGDSDDDSNSISYTGYIALTPSSPGTGRNLLEHYVTKYPERVGELGNEFRYFRSSDSKTGNTNFDFIIPRDQFNADKPATISCIGDGLARPDLAKCSVRVQVGDRLSVEYTLALRHMAAWRSIHGAVLAWVESLIAGCFSSASEQSRATPYEVHSCPM